MSLQYSRRVAAGLIVLACYGVLVTYLTWPLARRAATHLPKTTYACGFDSLYSGWALAHETTALLTDPARLAQGNNFHPASNTIFYGPTGFGALPYFAPVFWMTGNPTLALNLLLLFSIASTACTLHLVVRHWTGSQLGGAVAACSFLFTRWTLWQWLPTTPHAAVLQYFPLIILLAATPTTGIARNLALLALIVLQCLTDLAYVAPAVLAPLIVLAVARMTRRRTRAAGAFLLAIVALGGLALLVPAAGHLRVSADNPDLAHQGFWRIDAEWFRKNGTQIPLGLFEPHAPTALPGVALALLGVLLLSRRERAHPASRSLALWAGLGALMSLTPSVRFGDHAIDLPQAFLAEWVPLYGQIRAPSRLGVAALMSLSMLAGLAFAGLARRIAEEHAARAPLLVAAFAAVVLTGMYVEHRGTIPALLLGEAVDPPYPIAPAPSADGPFVERLRARGGPLIELPAGLGLTRAPVWHARAMYRSIFHGRPVLNGYASYWPSGFEERMALAERLPDRAALAALRDGTGVEMVWVHAREMAAGARASWTALADSGGRDDLRLVGREGEELLFEVGH